MEGLLCSDVFVPRWKGARTPFRKGQPAGRRAGQASGRGEVQTDCFRWYRSPRVAFRSAAGDAVD
jgi:hypothetical protein